MRKQTLSLTLLAALALPGAASAVLIDQGDTVYDTVLDISWLTHANLAATETFGLATNTALGLHPSDSSGLQGRILSDGRMNWPGALFWIDAMNEHDGTGYRGFADWRLATMSVAGGLPTGSASSAVDCATSTEVDCRDNELGYMYYYHLTPEDQTSPTAPDTDLTGDQGLFTDIGIGTSFYWTGLESVRDPHLDNAWSFEFAFGFQGAGGKGGNLLAWAVRPGAIAVQEVPGPGTAALIGAGVLGLLALRRRVRRL